MGYDRVGAVVDLRVGSAHLLPLCSVVPARSVCVLTPRQSVESQGRTLEQLEWVYDQPKPVQASIKVEKVVVQADGKVTEKIVADKDS